MNYSANDHIRLRRVSSIAASPDNSWLAVAVQRLDRDEVKYVGDIWKLPLDGGKAVQLTRGDSNDHSPCFRRDGSLGFLSNRQPNEIKPDEDAEKRMQVWILPASGGEPHQLTDEPLGVDAFKFSRAADRIVLLAPVLQGIPIEKQRETLSERQKKGPSARRFTSQPVRHWDQWLHEDPDLSNVHLIAYTASGEGRIDLTPDVRRELAIEPHFDVSRDGRLAAISWQTPGDDRVLDSTILVIDLETSERKRYGVSPYVGHDQALFSPDGRRLATVRSFRSAKEVVRPVLTVIELASGNERTLAAQWDRWPNLAAWTEDGAAIVVTADDEGQTPIFSIHADTGAVTRLTSRAAGGAYDHVEILDRTRLASIRSTLLDAPECVVVAAQAESTPQPLERLSGFTPADWAEVENCHVTSTDGASVQYYLIKPKGSERPLPALLWIHGGPIGMDTDGWHWRWNPLLVAAKGYAVALANPRGSTGFGQSYIQGIWGNVWGAQCYRDLMCVTDALQKRADIDGARIMAMGGSFGGYMTNWIGTQTDRFRCLITHASIFTMAHFTGVTDHPAWWYLEMGGEDPFADQAHFDRFAPVKHVKNWKTPTLIIHGERDYRCPISEGLNLFEALQYHKVPSELVIFPDENHWILKPKNILAWYQAVLDFLGRYMSEQASPASVG